MTDLQLLPHHPVLNDLINSALVFVAVWLLSRVVRLLLTFSEKRLAPRSSSDLAGRLIRAVRGPVGIGIWIWGLGWALRTLRVSEWGAFIGEVEGVAAGWVRVIDGLLFIALTLVFVTLLLRSVNVLVAYLASRVAAQTETRVDDELIPLARRLFQIVVWVGALIAVFRHYDLSIDALLVGLGAGSLAFALAAQETLSNMIAGFVIFLDRPFRVGDRILLEDGTRGDIYDIGLRSTKLLTFENTLMVIPNAQIVKEKITNLTYPDPAIRVLVEFGVAYGSDLEQVKRIVLEAVREHPKLLSDPEPRLFFTEFADSALQLRLTARTLDYKEQWVTTEEVRMLIWKTLYEHDIGIPFPQRDLWIRNWPPSGEPGKS